MAAAESMTSTSVQESKGRHVSPFDIFGLFCMNALALCILYFALFGQNPHVTAGPPAVVSQPAR